MYLKLEPDSDHYDRGQNIPEVFAVLFTLNNFSWSKYNKYHYIIEDHNHLKF